MGGPNPCDTQYPSIIRAHNLCYCTIALDSKHASVPGVEYYEIATGLGTFRYTQDTPGVVPSLLEDLAAYRKKAKKDMAEAKARGDDWAVALYNGKQLAYKITMNSVYGFMGATRGMMPMVPIAASVTATGRNMIQQTKRLAEELVPGSRVIYGDTVTDWPRAAPARCAPAHWLPRPRRTRSWSSSTSARTSGTTCTSTSGWRRGWRTRSPRPSRRPTSWSSKSATTRTCCSARSGMQVRIFL